MKEENTRAPHDFGSSPYSPLIVGLVGFILGVGLTWFAFVRPYQKLYGQWAKIMEGERDAISKIKTLSQDELVKWIATLDEQNVRYAELMSILHKLELALAGPAWSYILICGLVVGGTVCALVWMSRDVNADAARTLENAVSVLPSLRRAIRTSEKGARARVGVSPAESLGQERAAALEPADRVGVIKSYRSDRGFGFITPEGGGDDVFFHKSAIVSGNVEKIQPGVRVIFRCETDEKGRQKAIMVELK